jgi:hypothetical protein
MTVIDSVCDQSSQIQGGWPPKLQDYIISEDPPKHITRSTKTPKQKAIDDFRAGSPARVNPVNALDGWARELETKPESEARGKRLLEWVERNWPGLKPH